MQRKGPSRETIMIWSRQALFFLLTALVLILSGAAPAQPPAASPPPRDREIILAIRNGLSASRGVHAQLITVSAAGGVVRLAGTVDNILERERAQAIAEWVRGVRLVHNDIVVDFDQRTDWQIQGDLRDALHNNLATATGQIAGVVRGGYVTLIGRVDSLTRKQTVTELAKGIQGVREVDNQLEVANLPARPDDEMEKDIWQRLQASIWLQTGSLTVKVHGGQVVLGGIVGSLDEKRRATLAAWVDGVAEVNADGLQVRPWAANPMLRDTNQMPHNDDEIAQAIQDAFSLDPRLAASHPELSVADGLVTLEGSVRTLRARRGAVEDAWNTPGVRHVFNNLAVEPAMPQSDDQLTINIRRALSRDPDVKSYRIDLSAQGGKVYLGGQVDSETQRDHVEDVVLDQPGVVEIEDNLEIKSFAQPKLDWKIQVDTQRKIALDPSLSSAKLTVAVSFGTITLSGGVDSEAQGYRAIDYAYESGARAVNNEMWIRPDEGPPPRWYNVPYTPYRGWPPNPGSPPNQRRPPIY